MKSKNGMKTKKKNTATSNQPKMHYEIFIILTMI